MKLSAHFRSHYHRKYRSRFPVHHSLIWWFDVSLLFAISSLIVVAIFASTILPAIPIPPIVRIEALAPKSVTSGAPTKFVLTYSNDSDQALGCAELRIFLPPDTVVEGDFPRTPPNTDSICTLARAANVLLAADGERHDMLVYSMGEIAPYGRETISFNARTYGPTGSTKVMTWELRYWEKGKLAPSRLSTNNEWIIDSSVFGLELTLPPRIDRGLSHVFPIIYANRSNEVLRDAVMRLSVPEDYVVTGSSPTPRKQNEWALGSLAAGEFGTITVHGYFRTDAGSMHSAPTFTVRGYVTDGDGRLVLTELLRQNADPLAAALNFETKVIKPDGRTVLLPGETVTVEVRYKNVGNKAFRELSATLDPGATFVTSANPESLSWNASSDATLAEIAPGASGVLTATFKLPEFIAPAAIADQPFLKLRLSANGSYKQEGDNRAVLVTTPVLELPIATRLGIETAAYYYAANGDQVGVGPLPPKVGETTKYLLTLDATTTTGGATDTWVEASLPENVDWIRIVSVTAGNALDYLPLTRHIRWHVGLIPAHAGDAGTPPFSARFEVAVTPSASEAGSVMTLLRDIDIHASDANTGLRLHAAGQSVTTDLSHDKRAAGTGTVTK